MCVYKLISTPVEQITKWETFMWETEYSINVNSTADKVWKIWADVENWHTWDHAVSWSRLLGPFTQGTVGKVKPKKGPEATFTIVEMIQNERFVDEAKLPLVTLRFIHELHPMKDHLKVTHKIQIEGFTTFLFSRVIGANLEKDLPIAMQALKQKIESLS